MAMEKADPTEIGVAMRYHIERSKEDILRFAFEANT